MHHLSPLQYIESIKLCKGGPFHEPHCFSGGCQPPLPQHRRRNLCCVSSEPFRPSGRIYIHCRTFGLRQIHNSFHAGRQLAPSEGSIYIGGTIGYMLQKDYLLQWRSIRSNALLGLEIQKKLTPENIAYVDTLLTQYGLGDFKNSLPNQLSGGMRQRAALIRTLAVRPDILLLDEPFSALDYQTRLSVSDEIGTIIREEGKTAILVTHDISEAISLSDRVVVLSKRPASLKKIFPIQFSTKNHTPMQAREAPEFKDYFNAIWKELDVHVS